MQACVFKVTPRIGLSTPRVGEPTLREFTAENLRILIGQEIGLNCVVSMVIDLLAIDPWISGDYYEGDLLQSVLRLQDDFWSEHADLKRTIDEIVRRAIIIANNAPGEVSYESSVVDLLNAWNTPSR